jgi:hypothetical protein
VCVCVCVCLCVLTVDDHVELLQRLQQGLKTLMNWVLG